MIEHSAGYRVEQFNIYTDFGQVPTNVAKPVSITISPFSPEVSNRRNKFGYRSGEELFTASTFDVSQCNVESFEPKMRQVAKFSCFAETLASLYSLYSNGDDCSTRYDKINQVILASQKDLKNRLRKFWFSKIISRLLVVFFNVPIKLSLDFFSNGSESS